MSGAIGRAASAHDVGTSTTALAPFKGIARGITASVLMMVALSCLPATLAALADHYGLSSMQVGRLATAELLGLLVGTTAGGFLGLATLRSWTLAAAVLLAAANLALPLGAPISLLLPLRLAAGAASGIAYGFGLKVCAASARPTRMFGLLTGGISVAMVIGFQVISRLQALNGVNRVGGPHGGLTGAIFTLYALLAGVTFILLLPMHVPPKTSTEHSSSACRSWPKPLEWVGFLSIGSSCIGYGAVWAFLPLLGASYKLPTAGIANATSTFAFMSIVGSVAVGLISERAPRWLLGGLSLVLAMAGIYALYGFSTPGAYILGCAVCGFYWPFSIPLVMGVLARLDKTGRSSVLGGSVSTAGSALGPTIAGVLILGADYRLVGWMAAILCTVAFACLAVLDRLSERVEPATPV